MSADTLPVFQWREVESRSVPNLNVLSLQGREVGFIEKPNDSDGDRNAWRCYSGIGARAQFLGHEWSKAAAQRRLENVFRDGEGMKTPSQLNTFEKHQRKIACDTLKMHDAGAAIMGGMTKTEARIFLRHIGYSDECIAQLEEGK